MTALSNLRLPTRRYALGVGIAGEGLKYFRYWILAAIAVAFLGPLALSRYQEIDYSTWFYTGNVAKWFTVFVAAAFVYVLVPNMIATGLTRRELAVAMGVFGLLWSAVLGALTLAGFLAEHAYYDALGWSQGIERDQAMVPLETWGEAAAFGAVYALLYLLYFIGGTLIGAASYRWEGTGWLVVFPIALVVFSLDNAVFNTDPWGPDGLRVVTGLVEDWGPGVVLALIAAATAIGAYLAYRVLRNVPLRSKKA